MFYQIIKRALDILLSLIAIICLFSLLIIVAIIIKCTSKGPILYKAKRVGKGGKVFNCYKFRSMRVDSGQVKLTTLRSDDRIYPFGRFLRATKIDELPQLFNILSGKMSIVGPRPEDTVNAEKIYIGDYQQILMVKPGLTSPASLYDYTHGEKCQDESFYETDILPKKLFLELYYVKHKSFFYDVKLVFKTVWLIILTMLGKKKFKEPKELNKFVDEK